MRASGRPDRCPAAPASTGGDIDLTDVGIAVVYSLGEKRTPLVMSSTCWTLAPAQPVSASSGRYVVTGLAGSIRPRPTYMPTPSR